MSSKNILLITSLYPSDDVKILNNTAVCHYFAKEWLKMGYNVRVVFNYNVYPRFYYPVLRLFRKQMANILGVSIQDVYVGKPFRYVKDGITVDRLPIYKPKPGGVFREKELLKQEESIKEILNTEGFKPDFILGHFTHPNLDLVARLKAYFNVPGTIALHGAEAHYSESDAALFNKMDVIGYRSYPTKWAFEKMYGVKPYFMCPSGVPEKYITQSRSFTHTVSKFIYVGTFMRRKYASCLVPAIAKAYGNNPFSITFIGDGEDKSQIIKKAKENDCTNKI